MVTKGLVKAAVSERLPSECTMVVRLIGNGVCRRPTTHAPLHTHTTLPSHIPLPYYFCQDTCTCSYITTHPMISTPTRPKNLPINQSRYIRSGSVRLFYSRIITRTSTCFLTTTQINTKWNPSVTAITNPKPQERDLRAESIVVTKNHQQFLGDDTECRPD